MAKNYWIKLYHEILSDRKMSMLPDRLWRRIIELYLLAGKLNSDGDLPTTVEIAWELRLPDEDQLEVDLQALAEWGKTDEKPGLIVKTETGWRIPHFEDRQAPASDAERAQQYRNKIRSDQYNGDRHEPVTDPSRTPSRNVTDPVTDPVTKRDVDTDTDTDTDNRLTTSAAAAEKTSSFFTIVDAETMYREITGQPTVPAKAIDYLERILDAIQRLGWDKTKAQLTKAWEGWIGLKGKNGVPYSKVNPAWIDHGLANEVPYNGSQNGTAHKGDWRNIPTEVF